MQSGTPWHTFLLQAMVSHMWQYSISVSLGYLKSISHVHSTSCEGQAWEAGRGKAYSVDGDVAAAVCIPKCRGKGECVLVAPLLAKEVLALAYTACTAHEST